MNIRSIDLQVLIPRATEVSKIQQTADNQRMVQQQHVTEEWREISSQRQTQVQYASQAEEGVINHSLNPDGSGRQQYRQRKRKSAKNADEQLTEVNHDDPIRGNIIDIKT